MAYPIKIRRRTALCDKRESAADVDPRSVSHRSPTATAPRTVPLQLLRVPEESSDILHSSLRIEHILRAARDHLGMEIGFISEFTDGRRVFRHVESFNRKICIEVGASDPLEKSYCHWVAKGVLPQLIPDAADHPFTASFPVTKSLPVGAHVSVPIRLRGGKVYGTFCCFSTRPDQSLTERDLAVMKAFAQLAGEQIQRALDSEEAWQKKLHRIRTVIESRAVEMVYQPAFRLDEPEIAFFEALARFRSKLSQPPDQWFAAAAEVGLGVELEMLAVRLALEGLKALPDSAVVSINVSPQTLLGTELKEALSSMPLDRIILEITEHEAVKFYEPVLRALEPLRKHGLRVAVDDAGAGYASFQHILRLRPELIKLDMTLSRGIDGDPSRRSLAAALVRFAKEIGSDLVAEGVETESELRTLRELGVNFVQGHLLARPVPAAELSMAH